MRLMSFVGALALVVGTAWGEAPPKLTPEIINADASLSGPALRGPAVSPDGKLVTVLKGRKDDARQLDLWAYDLATGKSRMLVSSTDLVGADVKLSEEEKNRRERQRIYANGITSYDWDEQGAQIAVDPCIDKEGAKDLGAVAQSDAHRPGEIGDVGVALHPVGAAAIRARRPLTLG